MDIARIISKKYNGNHLGQCTLTRVKNKWLLPKLSITPIINKFYAHSSTFRSGTKLYLTEGKNLFEEGSIIHQKAS